VAVFRPVVRGSGPGARHDDPVLTLLRGRLPDGSDGYGVSYDDVHTDPDAAIATIVDRFHELEAGHDAVLVVGTDYTDVGAPTELAFNGRVALNLGAPVLLVVGGNGRGAAEILAAAELASGSLVAQSCQLLGVIANRIAGVELPTVRAGLAHRPGSAVLPEIPLLSAPSVRQVLDAANGELVFGEPSRAWREVLGTIVAAMNLPRVLAALEEQQLVIVPGDRSDILVGVLTAHASHTFPRLAGVLLTGGIQPDPIVSRLIEGLRISLPVATTKLNTFDSAVIASATRGALTDGSPRKIEAALEVFNSHVDVTGLLDRLDLARSVAVTPLMFEHDLVERARERRKRIVLPEGTEPRVLKAAARVLERGIADVVLLGDRHEVEVAAGRAGADVGAATVLDPHEEDLRHRLATEYVKRRAHKGITLDHALDVVVDVSYAGTLMVALGEADGMVSGAVHTTAHTIRP
jgi:phosphate acetyltransferase